MNKFDFIALDYKLKHAKSKKAVIDSYPELRGKTIKEVLDLIAVNIMVVTGKSLEEQKRNRLVKQKLMLRTNLPKKK